MQFFLNHNKYSLNKYEAEAHFHIKKLDKDANSISLTQ